MSNDKDNREPLRGRDLINDNDRFERNAPNNPSNMTTKTVSITLSSPRAYYGLTDPPDGVSIATPPPSIKKGFGPVDNFDVQLIFDATKVAGYIIAAWVVRSVSSDIRSIAGDMDMNADRIAEDETAAIDAIARKIESQENSD